MKTQETPFYDAPLGGPGLRGKLLGGLGRLTRKSLLPAFDSLLGHLAVHTRRLYEHDHHIAAVNQKADLVNDKAELINAKVDGVNDRFDEVMARVNGVNVKADGISAKADCLNEKLDQLNAKLDGVLRHFEAVRTRQAELTGEFEALVALHWDHVALARRLAQLEDRMSGAWDSALDDAGESIRFPGLERFSETGSTSEPPPETRSQAG